MVTPTESQAGAEPARLQGRTAHGRQMTDDGPAIIASPRPWKPLDWWTRA